MPERVIDRLAPFLRLEEYAAGEVILREGEASDRVCMLAVGQAAVYKGADGARLGSVEAGTHFGEMGVFSGALRAATVTAETPVRLWSLSLEALKRFETRQGRPADAHAQGAGRRTRRTPQPHQ
jgi:SulP family sulfate permease